MTDIAKKLIALGGTEWVSGDKRRIYFNAPVTGPLVGFEYEMRISRRKGIPYSRLAYAKLNGEGISNAAGERFLARLDGKLWFDLADGEFYFRDMDAELANQIIAALKAGQGAQAAAQDENTDDNECC